LLSLPYSLLLVLFFWHYYRVCCQYLYIWVSVLFSLLSGLHFAVGNNALLAGLYTLLLVVFCFLAIVTLRLGINNVIFEIFALLGFYAA
jgi:energy-coupling factor transporter transmembrane protein EcfT